MISSFLSTIAISDGMRIALAKAQRQLVDAQKELSTGRHADVGRTLGARTSRTISLRKDLQNLENLTDTNNLLSPKLEYSQSVLEGVSKSASRFLDSIIAARGSSQGAHVAKVAADDALKQLVTSMNATYDGQYIFGGINAGTKPIADYYETPAPANKVAVDTSFMTQFGVTQADPGVENILASDVQTFLDGPFSTLFDATGWSTTWSSSSNENMQSRISPHETIESSVNANTDAIRDLGQALTMVADLGIETMNDSAQEVVLDRAIKLVSGAIAGISDMRAGLGVAQERVTHATDRMSVQIDIYSKGIGKLENVDPSEAAVRITTLSTQMESAYALTARLSQMSLVKYL